MAEVSFAPPFVSSFVLYVCSSNALLILGICLGFARDLTQVDRRGSTAVGHLRNLSRVCWYSGWFVLLASEAWCSRWSRRFSRRGLFLCGNLKLPLVPAKLSTNKSFPCFWSLLSYQPTKRYCAEPEEDASQRPTSLDVRVTAEPPSLLQRPIVLLHISVSYPLTHCIAACFHVFSHWRHLPPATAMIATLLLSRQGTSTSPAKLAWRCHMKAWSVFLLFSTRGDQNLVVQEEASSTTKLRATRTSPRKDFAATMDDEIYDRASLGSTSSVNKIIHPDVQVVRQ